MNTVAAKAVKAHADVLLSASHLCRRFGGLLAVDDVSLALCMGEIHAVIGTNGAGKSTLINMLSGEIAPTTGTITFDGNDIALWSQPRRARAGIGRSYQRTTIFPSFTVLENCRLAAQAAQPKPWRFWQPAHACAHATPLAEAALAAAGLTAFATTLAGSLSHGQQRQLEIGMCLATGPRVLLLDEPLAGMGAEESERMLALLESLKATHAVLLVEHDMDAVFRVADRITVMVNGRVIASDTPAAIRTDPAVQQAYLGESANAAENGALANTGAGVPADAAASMLVGAEAGALRNAEASMPGSTDAGTRAESPLRPERPC